MLKENLHGWTLLLFLCFAALTASSQIAPSKSSSGETVERSGSSRGTDDFAGLTFSEEQKTEIEKIRHNTTPLMETVVRDIKLTPEQKGAMLDGYRRMEQRQIFDVLTPEQQSEVRKKITARRAEDQEKKKRKQAIPN
jgi:Spy/CpxP family protein refolding chaperone